MFWSNWKTVKTYLNKSYTACVFHFSSLTNSEHTHRKQLDWSKRGYCKSCISQLWGGKNFPLPWIFWHAAVELLELKQWSGKFLSMHLGHSASSALTSGPIFLPLWSWPIALRRQWLRERHPASQFIHPGCYLLQETLWFLQPNAIPPPPGRTLGTSSLFNLSGFPGGSVVKTLSVSQCRRLGSIPGLGRSPGGGNGNPLQYSTLGNPIDKGAWQATVHGVTKESGTTERLNNNHLFLKCFVPFWQGAYSFI